MIRDFASMTDSELRDAMNEFWRGGGYRYVTPRDEVYRAEIDSYLDDSSTTRPARQFSICVAEAGASFPSSIAQNK